MKALIFLLKNSKVDFSLALVTGLLAGASYSAMIALIHLMIQTELSQYWLYLISFVTAWIGYGVFSPASTYFLTHLSEKAILNLRITLTQKILKSSLIAIERNKSEIFVVLTEDINAIASSLEKVPSFFASSVIVVGCFIVMIWISPLLCLLLGIFLIIFLPLCIFPLNWIESYLSNIRKEWTVIFKHFYSLNHGIKELLINAKRRHDFLGYHLYPAFQMQYRQAIKYKTLDSIISRWGELFLLAGLSLLIFTLPNWGYISFRQISEFLFIVLFAVAHLDRILSFFNRLKKIEVSLQYIEKVDLLISSEKNISMEAVSLAPPLFFGSTKSLLLKEITYQYMEREHPFNFGPISLHFSSPSIVFITGGNGSGKSTFIKLLCGLYAPFSGCISLNDVKIEQDNLELYRQYFSTIFSDFYLFESLLGLEDLKLESRIKDYLVKLQLNHKVNINQGKFSTVALSQGQRKRLALLVSLLENKEIFIFDEWASDQDPYFKNIFYNQVIFELKARKKLIFVISHDESYYHLADQIIKFEDGKLVYDSASGLLT